jgi:DNA-binding NarL/FixJ family response regulator
VTLPAARREAESAIRTLIVGSDPLVREALALRLASEPGVTVTGRGAGEEDLPPLLAASRPDVILWDLGPGDADPPSPGLHQMPDLPVLGAVASDGGAAEALAAGARGVVLRDAPPPRIAAALRSIAHGLIVIDEPLSAALLRLASPSPVAAADLLTPREVEVLHLLALGLPNREIADRLFISERTAKFHVNALLSKLGARSRTEAVVRAARLGLVAL